MAGGKVKKGFTSYLLVLFLAIIATFLILITIMLFSPFKNILGFTYFTFKTDDFVFNVTGGRDDEKFNFETIENINIDCTFAEVKVERYYKIDDYALRFENTMTGFAREDQETSFTYEVYYKDETKKELNVKVHEPEGFLYFNKNITINVLIPTSKTYSLDNTALTITNTTGDIYIGNSTKVLNIQGEDFRNYITFGTINVKTNKGNTIIFPYANEQVKNLFIKTEKGKIESRRNLTVSGDFNIYAEKGNLDFKSINITSSKPAGFNLKDSEFSTPYLKGNVELTIKNGYFDVDNMEGILSSNNAVEQMSKANINIKEFSGYLSLPYVNNSKVTLGTVKTASQVYIQSTEGDIKIKNMLGNVAKVETTEGSIDVTTSGTDIDVKTTSGDIKVSFNSLVIDNQIDVVSKSGKINFNVKGDLAFILEAYNAKGELRDDGNVNVAWLEKLVSNPYPVNGGGKIISLTSNGTINVGLV